MKHLSFLAIIILSLFTSCSDNGGEKSVFECIPSESQAVARVNIDEILKNAGCQFRNGNLKVSPSMEYLLESSSPEQRELIGRYLTLYSMLDLKNVYLAKWKDNLLGVTAITDLDKMEEYLEKNAKESTVGKHTLYTTEDFSVMVTGNLAMIAESPEILASALDIADQSPLAGDQQMVDFLSQPDHTVLAFVRQSDEPRSKKSRGETLSLATVLVEANLHQQYIDAELTLLDPEGLPVDISEFIAPIDPQVLASVPAEAIGVLAVGENLGAGDLFSQLGIEITDILPIDSQWLFLTDFINGPLMLSATPASSGANLRSLAPPEWNITASMISDDATISTIMMALKMMMPVTSAKNALEDSEQLRFKISPELSLFVSQQSQLLTFSTDYIRAQEQPADCAAIFDGASFGVVVNVPYNSETMRAFNLPYGPNFTLTGSETAINMRFSLNGSSSSILESLAQTLQAVH